MAYEWDGRDTPSPPPKEPRFWQKLLVKTNTLSLDMTLLEWSLREQGYRVGFQYRDHHPPDSEWDQNLLLQLQVLLLHLKCAKIPLQRTGELSTFTGLIPAQAIKFYHLNSSCSSNWNRIICCSLPWTVAEYFCVLLRSCSSSPQRWLPDSSGWSLGLAHLQDPAVTALRETESQGLHFLLFHHHLSPAEENLGLAPFCYWRWLSCEEQLQILTLPC